MKAWVKRVKIGLATKHARDHGVLTSMMSWVGIVEGLWRVTHDFGSLTRTASSVLPVST